MTKLSVNINKVATIRNARGGDVPNVCQVETNDGTAIEHPYVLS